MKLAFALDFVPGDQDLLDQGNPVMDAIGRQREHRLAVIGAPPEREAGQDYAGDQTDDDPDERQRLAVEVDECEEKEAEEDQQQAGGEQPDDRRGGAVFQRLVDIPDADVHGFGSPGHDSEHRRSVPRNRLSRANLPGKSVGPTGPQVHHEPSATLRNALTSAPSSLPSMLRRIS